MSASICFHVCVLAVSQCWGGRLGMSVPGILTSRCTTLFTAFLFQQQTSRESIAAARLLSWRVMLEWKSLEEKYLRLSFFWRGLKTPRKVPPFTFLRPDQRRQKNSRYVLHYNTRKGVLESSLLSHGKQLRSALLWLDLHYAENFLYDMIFQIFIE